MLALRYAAVLALACWTGGLVVLGTIAAPVAFEVLPALTQGGRGLAGALVGTTLQRFIPVAYACGAIALASLVIRAVLGPRPRRFGLRLAALVLMVLATAYAGLVVFPRIAAAQQSIGAAPSTLPEGDPRRADFARLHGLSVSLQLVPLAGGLALLFWELED